jgi:hypothetical protein
VLAVAAAARQLHFVGKVCSRQQVEHLRIRVGAPEVYEVRLQNAIVPVADVSANVTFKHVQPLDSTSDAAEVSAVTAAGRCARQ